MGRRSELVDQHTVRVGKANKSEFKVACKHCRDAGEEVQFVSRSDAVIRHLNQCRHYTGPIPTYSLQPQRSQEVLAATAVAQAAAAAAAASSAATTTTTVPVNNAGGGGGEGASFSATPDPKSGATTDNGATHSTVPAKRGFDATRQGRPSTFWISAMERQLLRMLVSTGLPFSMVEDECFRRLLETLNPLLRTYNLIPMKPDMSRIFRNADLTLKAETNKELAICKTLSLTIDTWMNSAGRNTLAHVLRTPSGKLIAWEWDDVTYRKDPKTLDDIISQEELAEKMVAIVVTRPAASHFASGSDHEPRDKLPKSIWLLPCYDEELNYMMGDILGSVPYMKSAVSAANRVIQLFHHEMDPSDLQPDKHTQFLFIREQLSSAPIDTRWESALRSLHSFLGSSQMIKETLLLIINDPIAIEKSYNLVARELRDLMTHELDEILHVAFEFYSVMATYKAQAAAEQGARLRMILPTAQKLYQAIDLLQLSNSDELKQVLNNRLATWNVRQLVLATVLDPNYRRSIFDRSTITTQFLIETLLGMNEEVYSATVTQQQQEDLEGSFLIYLSCKVWPFSDRKYNSRSLSSFYWSALTSPDHPVLSRLASRIEACVVAPVDTDKLFADMGSIHSALRSNKTVAVDDTTDPAFRAADESAPRDIRDETELSTLIDICQQETTLNELAATRNEYTFETLFDLSTDVPAHASASLAAFLRQST